MTAAGEQPLSPLSPRAPLAEGAYQRVVVQRSFFDGPSDVVPRDLYGEVRCGTTARRRTRVTLAASTSVSCDTYFGRFPASYWQRWTGARSVRVTLRASGSGRILLRACDTSGDARTVGAFRADGCEQQAVTLPAELDRFLDGGSLWIEAETEIGEELVVADVSWSADVPATARLEHPTALVICTMNRVAACLSNLRVLADDPAALDVLDAVYVIDQGTEPVDESVDFKEAAERIGGRLHYIRQPNLGGAGGFTRGLYEVSGDGQSGEDGEEGAARPSNVLFMDDDVLLEPDTLVRIRAFSASTASPVLVGGQMLNLLNPDVLHNGAETADLDRLRSGLTVRHSPRSAHMAPSGSAPGAPGRQDRRVDGEYNGWWTCLIPHEVVRDVGYPLPVFFQGDDLEYGYRARAAGYPTVTLPGAGLWHMDFRWKDRDDAKKYFYVRNMLIAAALHGKFDLRTLTAALAGEFVADLLGMQYGLAATVIKAVDDFLAGPSVLHDGGLAALGEVGELRSRHPETKAHPMSAAPGVPAGGAPLVGEDLRRTWRATAVPGRLLAPLLGRHAHDIGAIPFSDADWRHVSLFRTAVVTDASQNGVRVRSYDRRRLMALGRQAAAVLRRLRKEGPAARDSYRRALPELTGRANWRRLYQLDDA